MELKWWCKIRLNNTDRVMSVSVQSFIISWTTWNAHEFEWCVDFMKWYGHYIQDYHCETLFEYRQRLLFHYYIDFWFSFFANFCANQSEIKISLNIHEKYPKDILELNIIQFNENNRKHCARQTSFGYLSWIFSDILISGTSAL